jgi:hypothetical protein
MTLFRPAVIEAQRRRVYGSVTLHQPTRLAAFSAVAVISVLIGTAYLALGQFARKETVAGWPIRFWRVLNQSLGVRWRLWYDKTSLVNG